MSMVDLSLPLFTNASFHLHDTPGILHMTSIIIRLILRQFGIKVQVEYLDGHDLVNGRVAQHIVGAENGTLHLTLLYRPGHYDILYPIAG